MYIAIYNKYLGHILHIFDLMLFYLVMYICVCDVANT